MPLKQSNEQGFQFIPYSSKPCECSYSHIFLYNLKYIEHSGINSYPHFQSWCHGWPISWAQQFYSMYSLNESHWHMFTFFLKFYVTNLSLTNNYWFFNQILQSAKCHSITLQSQNFWSLSIPISSFYCEKSFHHHHCFATFEFILIHVVDGLLN